MNIRRLIVTASVATPNLCEVCRRFSHAFGGTEYGILTDKPSCVTAEIPR